MLPDNYQVFIELRQEYRYNHAWTSAVQYRFVEEMKKRTGCEAWIESRNTFTSWWKTIVNEIAREALRRGLL